MRTGLFPYQAMLWTEAFCNKLSNNDSGPRKRHITARDKKGGRGGGTSQNYNLIFDIKEILQGNSVFKIGVLALMTKDHRRSGFPLRALVCPLSLIQCTQTPRREVAGKRQPQESKLFNTRKIKAESYLPTGRFQTLNRSHPSAHAPARHHAQFRDPCGSSPAIPTGSLLLPLIN